MSCCKLLSSPESSKQVLVDQPPTRSYIKHYTLHYHNTLSSALQVPGLEVTPSLAGEAAPTMIISNFSGPEIISLTPEMIDVPESDQNLNINPKLQPS